MGSWKDVLETAMKEQGYTGKDDFSLEELLKLAKDYKMTPKEISEQRISFACGMIPFSNTTITRDDIERAAQKMPLRHLKLVK